MSNTRRDFLSLIGWSIPGVVATSEIVSRNYAMQERPARASDIAATLGSMTIKEAFEVIIEHVQALEQALYYREKP
jgi:hypothetical protein